MINISKILVALCSAALAGSWVPESLAQDRTKITDGEALYADDCSSCHGQKLNNSSGGVTFDLRLLKRNEYERFVSSVINGKAQMPPWRGVLTDEEIEQLWAYVMANRVER